MPFSLMLSQERDRSGHTDQQTRTSEARSAATLSFHVFSCTSRRTAAQRKGPSGEPDRPSVPSIPYVNYPAYINFINLSFASSMT